MFNIKHFARQALLALTLALGSVTAMATPYYHVNVNTAGLSGTGLMDFTFLGLGGAPGATATLSNFSGAFGAEALREGAVSGAIPGIVDMSNTDAFNALTQIVTLGGMFSFDVNFSGDFMAAAGDGTTLAVSLYNDDFTKYLGVEGAFAQFDLTPGAAGAALVGVSGPNALADVAVVPEPSELLLLLTGLGLMGVIVRRRTR